MGMRRRAWLREGAGLAAVAALAPWLPACGTQAPLTVAYHPWPGYAPLHLAQHMGWWEDVPLRALPTGSATDSRAALADGRAHAAALTLDETLQAIASGTALRIVAVFNQSFGADVVLARPGFETPARWRGARLGHEAGAVGKLMADSWLRQHGLTPSQVQMVHLAYDQHEQAWHRGEVDLLVTCEPVASRLLQRGALRLFDSSQLPPDRPILDVLAIRRDTVRRHAPVVRLLVEQVMAAQHHLYAQPIDAAYRLARWLDQPHQRVLTAFRGLQLSGWAENRRWLIGDPPPLRNAAQSLQHVRQAAALPAPAQLPTDLIAQEFLPAQEPL